MAIVRIAIELSDPDWVKPGRIDPATVDATTEEEIARQEAEDEEEALRVALQARPADKNRNR